MTGIYALISKQQSDDRAEAYRLLGTALRKGYGWDQIADDRDLDPIREQPEFLNLLESLRKETARSH